MHQETQASSEEATQQLVAYAVQQIQTGADKTTIRQDLIQMGAEAHDVDNFLSKLYIELSQQVQAEELSGSALVGGLFGGTMAAVVSGIVWAFITVSSGYEIGYVAWGIGLLVGFGVVLGANGSKGLPLQFMAAVFSIVGVAIGKYGTFYLALKEMVEGEFGAEASGMISVFSPRVVEFFVSNVGSMAGGFDLIWIVLAVITAWRIPQGMGIETGSLR